MFLSLSLSQYNTTGNRNPEKNVQLDLIFSSLFNFKINWKLLDVCYYLTKSKKNYSKGQKWPEF